jgi:galactokinase
VRSRAGLATEACLLERETSSQPGPAQEAGESEAFAALRATFASRFARAPETAARAPGRVNLIGEHTDYNGGLVLPCAIDRDTLVVAARRRDGRLRIWSENEREERSFEMSSVGGVHPAGATHWSDYVRGVVFAFREAGHALPGLDVAISSRVPIGAGLSSSAAFTVALATTFAHAAGLDLDAPARAWLAHRAESVFLGIGSGVLDQFASALGGRDLALLIDCRSHDVRRVPLPARRTCLLVADSGVRRALADAGSGYRQRVAECRTALADARAFGLAPPGASSLRDLRLEDLPRLEAGLPGVLFRRARHVLGENERVLACAAALEAGDLGTAGEVLRAGHRSLRDDYAVSIPELDALCELGDGLPGVFGSRLTGAGFGGCTLHLADPASADEVARALALAFERRFGRRPPIVRVETADGAGTLPL